MRKVITLILALFLVSNIAIADEIKKMSYIDFFLDYPELVGVTVGVQGFIIDLGQLTYIYDKPGSMNGLIVNTEKLPRNLRKKLMKQCSSGCQATIIGTALDESISYIKVLKAIDIANY